MISDSLFSGLKTAQTQVAQSAERIVSQTAQPQPAFEQEMVAPVDGDVAPVQRAHISEPVVPTDTLVQDIVTLDTASAAYRANITAIKAWDEMTKAALSVSTTDQKA